MRAVPSPSGSNLPTFFRWCVGGMFGFVSGSGSDAVSVARVLKFWKEMEAHCGHISAEQEEIFARAQFICSEDDDEEEEEEEAEVFSTPPLTQQDPQRQGQSRRGQAGEQEEEEVITMCSVSASPSASSTHRSSTSSDGWQQKQRKPMKRACTSKVRAGTKIWPPTPTTMPISPPAPTSPALAPTPTVAPAPAPTPTGAPAPILTESSSATATGSPRPSPELDPLVRIVLMIPTTPLPTPSHVDILELARSRGIF